MNAYLDGMRKYATFSGRATRSQFWLFTLIFGILNVVGAMLDAALGISNPDGAGIITFLIVLVHFLPYISVLVRRLHDIDRSGWWYWLGLVPIIGIIVLIVFLCTRSMVGPNRFGPPAVSLPDANSAGGGAGSSQAKVEQLEKLASLRASGAIDEAEFQKMKSDLLNPSAR
ncbi:DUF805 domain-containing protein [Rhizobium sp. P38BS-XIX]|uniref:DUF805 domain-containing protein n=1 Tax=Rhizobium sp. P38BS-XIX TaxID=2726740 RepID=UPI00145755B8|nr:DUF805 domain-containing protein [Rhizobium sp. P38BS-XIX]NLR98877.1 DUF805 domain-containing protein [Rhizobium sp. P38BS-XIX]